MKAEDLEFRFEAQVADDIEWYGHALYKRLPYSALELIGKQMTTPNGFSVPIKYASADSEYGTETLFWMNINDTGTMATADVEIFNMRFPTKGFINVSDSGRMSVCLKADIKDNVVKKKGEPDKTYNSRYNYVMDKIKKKEKTKQGKDYTPYVIETPGEIKEEVLKEYTNSLTGFDEWKKRNIKNSVKETGVKSPLLSLGVGVNDAEIPF